MSRILLIDDEKDVRDLASFFLNFAGHEVVTADDGEEGLRRFDESMFDAVVTDLFMPEYTGEAVAKHVHNSGRKIPVVVITGMPWDIHLNVFDAVIDKPFLYEEFIECLESVIKNEQSCRAAEKI